MDAEGGTAPAEEERRFDRARITDDVRESERR
jgi:hypothetical protein